MKIKLREARLNKGISQETLADLVGMTQSNYNRRENGKKAISDIEWVKLAKALSVDKEVIYETNVLDKIQHNTVSIPFFNIPSFIVEDYERIKAENEVLKKKLETFESCTVAK